MAKKYPNPRDMLKLYASSDFDINSDLTDEELRIIEGDFANRAGYEQFAGNKYAMRIKIHKGILDYILKKTDFNRMNIDDTEKLETDVLKLLNNVRKMGKGKLPRAIEALHEAIDDKIDDLYNVRSISSANSAVSGGSQSEYNSGIGGSREYGSIAPHNSDNENIHSYSPLLSARRQRNNVDNEINITNKPVLYGRNNIYSEYSRYGNNDNPRMPVNFIMTNRKYTIHPGDRNSAKVSWQEDIKRGKYNNSRKKGFLPKI